MTHGYSRPFTRPDIYKKGTPRTEHTQPESACGVPCHWHLSWETRWLRKPNLNSWVLNGWTHQVPCSCHSGASLGPLSIGVLMCSEWSKSMRKLVEHARAARLRRRNWQFLCLKVAEKFDGTGSGFPVSSISSIKHRRCHNYAFVQLHLVDGCIPTFSCWRHLFRQGQIVYNLINAIQSAAFTWHRISWWLWNISGRHFMIL